MYAVTEYSVTSFEMPEWKMTGVHDIRETFESRAGRVSFASSCVMTRKVAPKSLKKIAVEFPRFCRRYVCERIPYRAP